MDGDARRAQEPSLIPPWSLDGRVVYLPVRHHSPACAWHVDRLIHDLRPDAVLIEGPRDASRLIPLLTHPGTAQPVAIYTTYVQRSPVAQAPEDEPLPLEPTRHAAYYPLCDYSPELAAIRAAARVGARARFIDLTFPEMVECGRTARVLGQPRSLLEESHLAHSAILRETCRRVGARDLDDLWDQLFELDQEHRETERFFRDVHGYCALARRDYTPEMLVADGSAPREAAMAAAVAEESGKVVVVTGGFHTVALPGALPAMPPPVPVGPADALVSLMRYGFEQLDRLNGYASGMPAPAFYQRVWEEKPLTDLLVELAREARKRNMAVSVADEIAALEQVRRLALLRGHGRPSREDLLDGIRSVYVKGSQDMEGVPILALARKLLAGDRVGNLPPEAGVPPLVEDFRRTAAALKVELDRIDVREVSLDLYRSVRARQLSRFFHRLRFLSVPFAQWVAGPDYVSGQKLERIHEAWKYRWSPAAESTLIERSVYGSTLEEAATGLIQEQFARAEETGAGRRADAGARLLLEACRMGLHRHTPSLLERTSRLVAEDGSFLSLVRTIEQLLVLHVSREPLEAHHLAGLAAVSDAAYARACYLLPALAALPESEEKPVLDALNGLRQAAMTLGDGSDRQALRHGGLNELIAATNCPPVLRGAASGMLFGDGALDAQTLAARCEGHLHAAGEREHEGAAFLRGLLHSARSVLWLVPEIVHGVHGVLRNWDEDRFVAALPELRLAFADLTPRECDQVARTVTQIAGAPERPVS